MKKIFALSLVVFSAIKLNGQEATVKEEIISLPTYPFSDPDPVARPGRIYPYFRFDGYSTDPVDQKHRMVVLENKWIKVWIAPDMGGKVYGAMDKRSGKFFIYYNKVVKFREIAMRGPWTSGGIEFNFGSIGHAPTTATPVDYRFRYNSDGSVSCFLGATELTSRTEWRVEVKLPPDKAWFEINSTWYNPTEQKTSLYHWQTAAADATPDLEYYFPGTAYIDHGGNAFGWPLMPDGRDISKYRNNNYGGAHSYHVLGEYTDWFAGYYHKSGYGFGHWSRYPYKPGKKIWIWGLSRQGEIWKGLLTDSARGNEQYTEIQTGLLFNQEADGSTMSPFKHLYFMPGAVESFSERWFPLGETGGVSSVSQEGILNVENKTNGCRIIFQSLGYLKDFLQVWDTSGNMLHEYQLAMEPAQLFVKEFSIDPGNLIVRLLDGELYYQAGSRKRTILDRPLKILSDFNWESAYGLYTRGIEKSRQRSYSEARYFLDKCLDKDPDFLPAYTALAEIDYREMRYSDAEKKVLHVLGFDTYDPDANFLYGNILMLRNEHNKARDAYGVTLRSPAYKPVSLNRLAIIALRENRLEEAWSYVTNAGLYNGMDNNIYQVAIVTARKRRDSGNHDLLLRQLGTIDPISHFAAFERYYTAGDSASRKNFISGFHNELKHESFIELALWYYNCGLEGEAFEIMKLAPAHPLADLLAAWLAYRKNDITASESFLQRAVKADDRLVFPYRPEYAEILKWADKNKPSWKLKYYSALLFWNFGLNDTALEYFRECGNEPDSYSFYLSRGSFYKNNGGNEEKDYLEALKYARKEWRPYHLLHDYYMTRSDFEKAGEVSGEAMKHFPGSFIIRVDHAMSLINTGRYSESLALLENTEVLPYEGAGYGRILWRQANMLEGLRLIKANDCKSARERVASARLWPENLGVGRPYEVDESYEDLLEAYCLIKTGKAEKAKQKLLGVAAKHTQDVAGGLEPLAGVIALQYLKRNMEAADLLNKWIQKVTDMALKDWALKLCGNLVQVDIGKDQVNSGRNEMSGLAKRNPDIAIAEGIYRLFSP